MSKKTLLLGSIASIIAINSVLADTTVTSKQYVDTTRQATIPAAETNYEENGGGVSVVTYTEDAGVLGERFICDLEANMNGNCNDDNLVTQDVVNDLGDYLETEIHNVADQIEQVPATDVANVSCYLDDGNECLLWRLSMKRVLGGNGDACILEGEYCSANTAQCCSGICNRNKCEKIPEL